MTSIQFCQPTLLMHNDPVYRRKEGDTDSFFAPGSS